MMGICKECRDRLYPDNPEVAQFHKGKRYPPLCEACPNYNPNPLPNLREIEKRLDALKVPAWSGKEWDKVLELQGRVIYLQNKLNEHLDKKIPEKSTYRGLKK